MPGLVEPPASRNEWWRKATIYQIYPSSFKASKDSDVGDLQGIISKLDYLKDLGVDCLWINPCFQSPQYDMGYDISDYTRIWDRYGTNEDADELIKGAHERGIKVVFDLVINHTSHQHKWFEESRSSKDNPKRDWYVWRPAKYVNGVRKPPNNWRSCFGGSVWEWDEKTEEYYLHYFCKEQPDLNWEVSECRQAIYKDAILFWLDKGIDGFRIDTVNMYSKWTEFPDVPVTEAGAEYQWAGNLMCNGPRLHEFLKEMNAETFSKYKDIVTIGECPHTHDVAGVLKFVAEAEKELSMCFQFTLVDIDHGGHYALFKRDWNLKSWKAITTQYQELMIPTHGAWGTTYLENHDQARSVTRFGSDAPEYRGPTAKMLATYILTLSGTAFIYQGQEIGTINCPQEWDVDKEYIDLNTIGMMDEVKATGDPELLKKALHGARTYSRDHSRTPVQWDDSENAGFSPPGSKTKPWMRVMDSFRDINVASQVDDPSSPLAFYRELLKLRKAHQDAFVFGAFEVVEPDNEATVCYFKRGQTEAFFVALNFTAKAQPLDSLPPNATLLVSSLTGKDASGQLQAYEARIYTV